MKPFDHEEGIALYVLPCGTPDKYEGFAYIGQEEISTGRIATKEAAQDAIRKLVQRRLASNG